MHALVNCVCGAEAEHKALGDGRVMYHCPKCKHFTEPGLTESSAVVNWNNANSIDRVCLGCGGYPRLRYSRRSGMWSMQCTGCRWYTSGAETQQGAITAWVRSNRPGDPHIKTLWMTNCAGQHAF